MSQYALKGYCRVFCLFLLLTSNYLILNERNTLPCLGFSSDSSSCIFEHVFTWPLPGQDHVEQGRSWIIHCWPCLLVSGNLSWDLIHQKSATYLTRTGVAMVVITVKELKEPFTVLRPEEFLENNRSPWRSSFILLQKKVWTTHMNTYYTNALVQDSARIYRPQRRCCLDAWLQPYSSHHPGFSSP